MDKPLTDGSETSSSGDLPILFFNSHDRALEWYGTAEDTYYSPPTWEAVDELARFVHALPDGCYLPVRGRDWECMRLRDRNPSEHVYGPWDYGCSVKTGKRLFFLYESGDIESFMISGINFKDLVHFVRPDPARGARISAALHALPTPPRECPGVVLINHGWSDIVGPDYPLIRTLEAVAAKQLGWHVIVPDFRASYKFGSRRGRSERVKIIYEELLCCEQLGWSAGREEGDIDVVDLDGVGSGAHPMRVVMVGHSQGGAASSLACTDRVVRAKNIVGLMLLGSESPLSLDGMDWIPTVPNVQVVHSEGDSVIGIHEIEHVVRRWNVSDVDFHRLNCTLERGSNDCWGDDIHHEFTAKQLMRDVVRCFIAFLRRCADTPCEGAR